jgi:Tol biopolymer transport system component
MGSDVGNEAGSPRRYSWTMQTTTFVRPVLAGTLLVLVGCAPQQDERSGPAVTHEPEAGEQFFANVRQLTFGGQNAEAYFSPDGTQLIFQRTPSDSGCDQQYTIDIDGSDLTLVSNGLGRTTCGYFYDGGARIVYSSTFHVDKECPPNPDFSQGYVWPLYDFDIYTSRPDGEDLEQLFSSPGYDGEATLSPDGERIVFTSTRDGDLDIYTMNVDGSDVRQLTTMIGYDGGPFFSHDGSTIVYRSWHPETVEELADYQTLLAAGKVRPSRMEVWVMNADGSDQRQVTRLGGANFAPFFLPDDERIIFSSNHQGGGGSRNFDLFVINVDGSGLVQVTTHEDFDGFPMFSPASTQLVFASNRHGSVPRETNIFIADWVEP